MCYLKAEKNKNHHARARRLMRNYNAGPIYDCHGHILLLLVCIEIAAIEFYWGLVGYQVFNEIRHLSPVFHWMHGMNSI